jgi:hypothetical protein
MRFFAPTAIVIALTSGVAFAHEDSPIQIRKDGTLVGLPKQFQPSSIKIVFDTNANSEHPVSFLSFTIGKTTIQLPKALTSLLRSQNMDAVLASASWYHNLSHLPPYMEIEFRDPGFDNRESGNPGFRMSINLNTGKLMSMGRTTVNRVDRSWQTRSLKLSEYCTSAELARFYEPWVIR